MGVFAKLQHRPWRGLVGGLLLLLPFVGCASVRGAMPAASAIDLSREEMFLALTSHDWCDRDMPQVAGPSIFGEFTLRSGLALHRDGTFVPEYTSDIGWGPVPTQWNFVKTGPRGGVLYLVDPYNRTGRTVLFEFATPNLLRLARLWDHDPVVFTYGRCEANPPVNGRADDLPKLPKDEELSALTGTRWVKVDGHPYPEDAPSAIEIFGDGRTYVTLPRATCASSPNGRFGFPLRKLRDGRCIEAVPYNSRYRRSARVLLFENVAYLPAGTDPSRKYMFLPFYRGQVEGVVEYVPPLRLPAKIRIELWPRPDLASGSAGTVTVTAAIPRGDEVAVQQLGTAVFNVTIPAGDSVEREIELQGVTALDCVDPLTVVFTHLSAANDSAPTARLFIDRRLAQCR